MKLYSATEDGLPTTHYTLSFQKIFFNCLQESFKNGTESFQEELLEIIEDFSTLLTKLVLDSPRIQTRRDNFSKL